jgi:hypothetical protein
MTIFSNDLNTSARSISEVMYHIDDDAPTQFKAEKVSVLLCFRGCCVPIKNMLYEFLGGDFLAWVNITSIITAVSR